jgi:hypothetical protein
MRRFGINGKFLGGRFGAAGEQQVPPLRFSFPSGMRSSGRDDKHLPEKHYPKRLRLSAADGFSGFFIGGPAAFGFTLVPQLLTFG